jgi:putative ABC transport system permease protein
MDALADFRIAARGLFRSKGFAVASALTLALGIAATTTIFSVVYGVLLRPLPYRDVDRLVIIEGEKAYSTGPRIMNFSGPELEPFASGVSTFSSVAISRYSGLTLRNESGARPVPLATVSGAFFSTLGVNPILGRTLGDERDAVIVISQRFWQDVFASSPEVLGKSITLEDGPTIARTYTIVGVMPAEFQLPYPRTDVWRTLAFARSTGDGRVNELVVGGHQFFARIKDGFTFDAASADAYATVARILKPHFLNSRIDIYAKTTRLDDYVRGTMGPTLWVLMGAVTLVLLVACTNVTNLILARQMSRAKEISVRLALGAPRRRLIAHLVSESAMLAAVGAIASIAITIGAVRILQWMQPALTRLDAVVVDFPVLAFATVAAALSAMLAALAPAVLATRSNAAVALRAGNRSTGVVGVTGAFRSTLIVVEIAASIVLIIGAALLARSLAALVNTDVAVNTQNVVAINLDLSPAPGRPIDDSRRRQITSDLQSRLAALPTVIAVGAGSGVPPHGEFMRVSFELSNGTSTESHLVTMVPANAGYFRALNIRLISGRLFDDRDDAEAPPVVIINREAARRFFGNESAVGRTLPMLQQQFTIVGIVDNVKYTGIAAGPESVLYQPYAQRPMPIAVLFARTNGSAHQIAADIRSMIRQYDPRIGVPRLWTLDQWIADATAQPRFRTVLLAAIAAIALCLAMIGLYGVISYSTTLRTSEIALRMAVGAQPSDVIRLVLAEGSRLALVGVIIGLIASYGATRLIASFLYGVEPTDAFTFLMATTVLLIVALTATYFPARRAARVDPMTALRAE